MPHMEAEQEIDGLIFWDAAPTVRLLDSDFEFGAMLLERCEPGTALSSLEEAEQDLVLAEILKRLWRPAGAAFPFRPLSFLIEYWTAETRSSASKWHDECLIQEGLQLFHELVNSSPSQQVLATDLHAGNILRAQRAPWLVIDPKPFVGDPAFDATQHLINCKKRVRTNPIELIRRFAGLLELDPERVRLWLFARAAAEPRDNWNDSNLLRLARILAR
jgi:streptomycin 6-kinase